MADGLRSFIGGAILQCYTRRFSEENPSPSSNCSQATSARALRSADLKACNSKVVSSQLETKTVRTRRKSLLGKSPKLGASSSRRRLRQTHPIQTDECQTVDSRLGWRRGRAPLG